MIEPKAKNKSWLDLSVEELEEILASGTIPPNLEWGTLPQHPEFTKIFRYREQPAKIAKILLESITKASKVTPPKTGRSRIEYVGVIPLEQRTQRLELKRQELELAKGKQKNQTVMFEKILQIETDIHTIKKYMKDVLSVVRGLDARSRRDR